MAGVSAVSGTTSCARQTFSNSVCAVIARLAQRCAQRRCRRRQLDAIDHLEEGAHAGFDDVGGDAGAAVSCRLVAVDGDDRLALRVVALADAADLELAQTARQTPVACSIALSAASTGPSPVASCVDDAGRRGGAARRRLRVPARRGGGRERLELPRAAAVALGLEHERFDVAVEQLLLLVGERLEVVEHLREFLLAQVRSRVPRTRSRNAWRPLCLPSTRLAAREAHVLRAHDLVRRGVASACRAGGCPTRARKRSRRPPPCCAESACP